MVKLVQLPTAPFGETEDKNQPFFIRAHKARNCDKVKERQAAVIEEYKQTLLDADIILVSGGNTAGIGKYVV